MPSEENTILGRILKYSLLCWLRLTSCEYSLCKNLSLPELLRVAVCHSSFKFGRKSRFPKYDPSKNDPYKRGLCVPEIEKRIEFPIPHHALELLGSQELLMTGMRTSGELLLIRFVRARQRQAQVNILLRDSKGRTFVSYENVSDHLKLDISQGNKFQAGGLRLQCFSPMRKWRAAFNGLMVHKETGQSAYVKFSFLWIATSDVLDWSSSIPSKRLMAFCLQSKGTDRFSETISNVELCREHLNGFEQSGYLVGFVQVAIKGQKVTSEEDEQELHLRGNFLRVQHPQQSKLEEFSHSFNISKDGHLLQFSSLRFNNDKSLIFGSFLSTPGFKDPLESVINSSGAEADNENIQSSPALKFSTFERTHEILRSEGKSLVNYKSSLGWNSELQILSSEALIDGITSINLTLRGIRTVENDVFLKPPINILDVDVPIVPTPYVLNIQSPQCKNSNLSGGKGSSLAVLSEISHLSSLKNKFLVPGGLVVTTEAFNRFLQSPKMVRMCKKLQSALAYSAVEDVKKVTDSCINDVFEETIPSCITKAISEQLYEIFPDFSSRRFAIRSSCAGEDSEEMSAAGQMQTFLGVKGEQEIFRAVIKCWASQFSHIAVEYKRRYGQKLVSEMAVVIMEMVPAENAGVMFTCDPLTGDPSTIYISSNFGLGESVVSAMADPDTVRVTRTIDGKMTVNEVVLGTKDVKIVMNSDGTGTKIENLSTSSDSSISTKQAAHLARVGADIERFFGDWRDVEWAFVKDSLFMLQARPVTFMDRFSDDEVIHEFDSPILRENVCMSRANVGEVLNGVISPLGMNIAYTTIIASTMKTKGKFARLNRLALSPYASSIFYFSRYHCFLDLAQVLRGFVMGQLNDQFLEAMMLNLCGRKIEDPQFHAMLNDETDFPPSPPFLEKTIHKAKSKYFTKFFILYNKYLLHKKSRFPKETMDLNELYEGLISSLYVTIDYACDIHLRASNGSAAWTGDIVDFLQKKTNESNETIYSDMARFLASAQDVISCDAPKELQNLTNLIIQEVGKDNFINAPIEKALEILNNEALYPETYAAYKNFMKRHGHRGYNEFDVYRKPWSQDPSSTISTLQAMLHADLDDEHKSYESIWAAINGMSCRLTWPQKAKLAILVSFARRQIGYRENTKSLWIWAQHVTRHWSWALAKKMKAEGFFPDEELFFFCSIDEVGELLKNRNPAILARAFHRKKLFPQLALEEFPELSYGEVHPVVAEPPMFDDGVVQMKGFPINKGQIKAKARVITKLEDAPTIQRGEILITYATDIAWSPYFPLLGGIVTELGGLMSHGAVVAREFGLPCVIGLHGATKVFQTGDTVFLDGASGVLALDSRNEEE